MKKIVIYFTYTGNTKMIANKISKILNCDILEIKPKVPYVKDYNKVVEDEHNSERSNYLPEIENINIDLNDYNEIIIGTPVWWYRPAPVIRTFLNKFDLSDKKVIPFATNAGWLGKTFKEIKELCPNSEVCNEMNIVFESYSDKLVTRKEEIDLWIDSIE